MTEEAQQAKQPCGCPVCHLFGDVLPGVNDPEGPRMSGPAYMYHGPEYTHASRVRVADAIGAAGSIETLVRDSVGIDRASGAAARAGAVKFDAEVVPPGTTFDLRIELDDSADTGDVYLLVAALAEWAAGRGYLGGRTARGLGHFRLEKFDAQDLSPFRFGTRDLETGDGLMGFLAADDPAVGIGDNGGWFADRLAEAQDLVTQTPDRTNSAIASRWVEVETTLVGKGPVLTHDATLATLAGFDHVPLLANLPPCELPADWKPNPVLTGAGLRGVLRTRAEKIARTLWTAHASAEDALARCPACNPTESRIKTRRGESKAPVPLSNCDTLLRDGDLRVGDEDEVSDANLCLACRLFGSVRRGSRLRVEDAPLAQPLPDRWWKAQDFLAIDRFLGGGLENAKFDALPLMNPDFRLRLRLENPEPWELGWLALTLRDLYDGLLRVGFGAAKGYGQVKGQDIVVRVGYLQAEDFPGAASADPDATALAGLYRVTEYREADWRKSAALREQVENWVKDFVDAVKGYRRQAIDPIPADSFFGTHLNRWFGGER